MTNTDCADDTPVYEHGTQHPPASHQHAHVSRRATDLITVLDLPALYTKPGASTLIELLTAFTLPVPSWDGPAPVDHSPPGLEKWLISVVSSSLRWIDDPDEHDTIRDLASQRISERCGRSGRGSLERKFRIPLTPGALASGFSTPSGSSGAATPAGVSGAATPVGVPGAAHVDIVLHEPALTEDNLGFKTWASSYMLAKRLCVLAPVLPPAARVLELGAGTGLVGLAAAAVLRAPVTLTDLPDIVPNLRRNVALNSALGGVVAEVLDWTVDVDADVDERDKFGIVLAADSIYAKELPKLLVGMVRKWLSRTAGARFVAEMPLREGFDAERRDFRERMRAAGLVVVDEGTEMGRDDWGKGGEIECWWSVWGWEALSAC